MEQPDNPAPASSNPNGFVNRVFNVSLDVENETSSVYIQETGPEPAEGQGETPAASSQTHVAERQEVNRRPRLATGGIWRILNRKRAGSELERRPHSMILPGEASVPKLSFADKVRSFKKLKSPSVFRGRTEKLSTAAKFGSSLTDEDSFCRDFGTPQQSGRSALRHRAKRHSYAGHTAEFDCSFEDIDLSATLDGHRPAAAAGEAVTPNGCKLSERVCYTKRSQGNSNNCNKTSACCNEPSAKGSPGGAQHGRGRRHKDVWSYLRRISILGKANPVYSERSFDSELPSLDKTMDSDYGSVDFGSVRDFQPPPPKHSDPKGHFGGLFKFFTSVADTARKWRTTTHSFSPPEGERTTAAAGSPRPPQPPADGVHSVSLTLRSEGLPKSPATAKSSRPPEAPSPGGGSPKVVLKAFRACPGAPAVNGLQSSEGDGDSNHRSTAKVENHTPRSETQKDAEVERDPSSRLCEEETVAGQTGNERDSRDAATSTRQTQEASVQSQRGDKGSAPDRVPASDSTEEIFKVRDFKCKVSYMLIHRGILINASVREVARQHFCLKFRP
ncbi:hypothetical protein EYF80_055342 [Liparis tanakae]|uniref:Uncharacterized protein n=1 Tax=Liparis tanakae TaxID=230148 RepID=A0A4Z2F0L1_9TELE|nr:hypothetical protein EYF80_055342 [Liparis tanakae]